MQANNETNETSRTTIERAEIIYDKYGIIDVNDANRNSAKPDFHPTPRLGEIHDTKYTPIDISSNEVTFTEFKVNTAYRAMLKGHRGSSTDLARGIKKIIDHAKDAFNTHFRNGVLEVPMAAPFLALEFNDGLILPVTRTGYSQEAIRKHFLNYGVSLTNQEIVLKASSFSDRASLAVPLHEIQAVHFICAASIRSFRRAQRTTKNVQKLFGAPQDFESMKDVI